jgi:tetratricopeptide (TPR) repeat protein
MSDSLTLKAALAKLAELPLNHVPAPAPLPPGSRLPRAAHPAFVGREDALKTVAKALKGDPNGDPAPVVVTIGPDGIGKSQLAVEFAHRYGQYFRGGVFWLSFTSEEAIPTEVAQCAPLPEAGGGMDLDTVTQQVVQSWQEPLPRLLIFDNCNDEALLARWRPPRGGCRILVTARRQVWKPMPAMVSLSLQPLTRSRSIELLRHFRPAIAEDEATAIAAELADLPLALQLAGAYLRRYRLVSEVTYLARLQTQTDRQSTPLARAFSTTYGQLNPIQAIDRQALALLQRAACFAPGEVIPRALLATTAGDAPDMLAVEVALGQLVELGLLEERPEPAGGLAIHRLVAACIPRSDEARAAVEETMLSEAWRLNESGYLRAMFPRRPHLMTVTAAAMARGDERAANLASEVGYHLNALGQYHQAMDYYHRALAIDARLSGPDHPDIAISLNNLAELSLSIGDTAAARPYYERALAIQEKALGPDHPETAISLNNLATVLEKLGEDQAARLLYERALAVHEKTLGEDHPHTATSLNNLAGLLRIMGDTEAAQLLSERVRTIHEKNAGRKSYP